MDKRNQRVRKSTFEEFIIITNVKKYFTKQYLKEVGFNTNLSDNWIGDNDDWLFAAIFESTDDLKYFKSQFFGKQRAKWQNSASSDEDFLYLVAINKHDESKYLLCLDNSNLPTQSKIFDVDGKIINKSLKEFRQIFGESHDTLLDLADDCYSY